ncbi:MAG: PAS domain S-box protein [Opitutaceae bacterium]|nr:PAS domain S-box protein [Opitutaceae bacterium]
MNLLIVDDQPTDLKLLRAQLEPEGHAAFEAHDGVDALALLERQRVDVVISDILMPRMDGYRLCYEIRKHARLHDLPVIFYTSIYTSPSDEKLALDVGADKYLKKPASVETLVAALHEVIAQPRAAPRAEVLGEVGVLKEYSERLVNKLEERSTELMAQIEALRLPSAALSAAANAILIANRDGTIVWVNPAFTALTGYTLAEAVGKNSRDLVKSGQEERAVYQNLWETILSGRTWQGQLVNRRRDGSFYPEEQTITPVRDAAGEITHFIAIKQDLSERKHAEEALRQSEERYRLLFERARDVIFALAPTGAITSLNHAFETITGWPPAQWLGRPFQELIHLDDQPRAGELFQLVLRGESAPTFELRVGTAAGGHRDVEFTGFSSELSGGRIEVQGIGRDVTERKQVEEALRQSEERYRQLFEHNPLPMWLYDLETLGFLAVNESAVRAYGYSRDEFLGMTIERIRPKEDIPALLQSVAHVQTVGGRSSGEYRHRRKDGTIFHVEIISGPLMFEGRKARLVLAADITEKKLIEGKFLHAQRLESIGMLAAGIAHDLNNVLAPIMFAAPMLRDSLKDPRDLKILDTLEKSAERGAGLVRQILGFAHSTTGEFQPTQVKHLARDIVSVIEETFPKSIQLEHQIPSDLWPVQGSATQIHQVLMNLCVNARDAMPQGGTLHLTAANRRLNAVEAEAIPGARPGDWLVFEVTDTGTGISPEILESIWTPFFTTKGVGKGTGLGLSTVYGIVAGHKGFVELQTEVGRGTTFRVFFPAVENESPRSGSAAPADNPDGHGELILLVDDDAAIRDFISAILRQRGYRVVSCADGVEAIAHFTTRRSEISLVITDVDMPRLGGVALARALLQLCPDIQLLAMSGLSRAETDVSGIPVMKQLAHAFLLKPFTADDLLAVVHRLLHPAKKP